VKRLALKLSALSEYESERENLSEPEIESILDAGRKWDLSEILRSGGSLFFPHTYIVACGQYIASAVHASLDSGADQILILGVLHAFAGRLWEARQREIQGEDLFGEPYCGILGSSVDQQTLWQTEFCLKGFLFLLDKEAKRRGVSMPRVYLRYPFLSQQQPERLRGIEELKSLLKDSILVATADMYHHGAVYGTPERELLPISPQAYRKSQAVVQRCLSLLTEGDYQNYYHYSLSIRNDAIDVGSVLRYVLGPLEAEIMDMTLVDTSALFEGQPQPSWVAASLISLTKKS